MGKEPGTSVMHADQTAVADKAFKSEKEKVEYCEKYYEQSNVIEDLEYEIQMQDTVIEFLNDDNQILSSFLGEMELKQNK